jgi:hypothetical protein
MAPRASHSIRIRAIDRRRSMGEFLRGQKAKADLVQNLFGLEDALDFFETRLPKGTGQDPFFEES